MNIDFSFKAWLGRRSKIKIMGGDAVHPGPPGQAVMAASILKGMNFPVVVSKVEVNLTGNGPLEAKTTNCEVKVASLPGGGLTLTRKDQVLPYFPDEAKAILKFTPLLDEMNDNGLKVVGLTKGDWEVFIGDKKVAQYTAEQLEKGVNLAEPLLTSGPLADNVKKVWTAVKNKNRYFHDDIFRGVLLAGPKSAIFKDADPKNLEAVRKMAFEERMKKMPELDKAVREALQTSVNTEYVIAIRPAKKP